MNRITIKYSRRMFMILEQLFAELWCEYDVFWICRMDEPISCNFVYSKMLCIIAKCENTNALNSMFIVWTVELAPIAFWKLTVQVDRIGGEWLAECFHALSIQECKFTPYKATIAGIVVVDVVSARTARAYVFLYIFYLPNKRTRRYQPMRTAALHKIGFVQL